MWANSLVLLLAVCLCFDYVQLTEVEDSEQWDVLIYTQQWPATVCKDWEHNPNHKCAQLPSHDSWTIHGIWPTKFGTIGPGFCNNSWHFDVEQVRPIEPSLLKFWPNIEGGKSEYSLWAHEWSKHGTCAAVLEPLNSEIKYFSKGLEWLQKYSMTNILQETGITPDNSKTYTETEIANAVKTKLGVNPDIQCRKENGVSWLDEIRICFKKSLELTDCDGIKNSEMNWFYTQSLTNCDSSQGVLYPHDNLDRSSPNIMLVRMYELMTWLQWFTL